MAKRGDGTRPEGGPRSLEGRGHRATFRQGAGAGFRRDGWLPLFSGLEDSDPHTPGLRPRPRRARQGTAANLWLSGARLPFLPLAGGHTCLCETQRPSGSASSQTLSHLAPACSPRSLTVPHCPMTVRGHPPVRPRACSLHCPHPGHRWGAPGCRYQSVALSSPQCCSELPSGSLLPRTSPTLAAVGPWQKPEDPHCGGRRAGGVGDWAAAQQRPRHPHSQLCGRRASGAGAMAPALPVSGASGVGVGRQEESTIAT